MDKQVVSFEHARSSFFETVFFVAASKTTASGISTEIGTIPVALHRVSWKEIHEDAEKNEAEKDDAEKDDNDDGADDDAAAAADDADKEDDDEGA